MSQFVDELQKDGAADLISDPEIECASLKRVTTFLAQEAPKIHPMYAGASRSPRDEVDAEIEKEYSKKLALTLQEHVPPQFGVIATNPSKEDWDELCKAVSAEDLAPSPQGRVSRIVDIVGKNKDAIDPWVSLIPNEYGLAVVKTAMAIALKLAERHGQKKKEIFDTLAEIRRIVGDVSAQMDQRGMDLYTDPYVSRSCTTLHQTIQEAMEQIIRRLCDKGYVSRTSRVSDPDSGGDEAIGNGNSKPRWLKKHNFFSMPIHGKPPKGKQPQQAQQAEQVSAPSNRAVPRTLTKEQSTLSTPGSGENADVEKKSSESFSATSILEKVTTAAHDLQRAVDICIDSTVIDIKRKVNSMSSNIDARLDTVESLLQQRDQAGYEAALQLLMMQDNALREFKRQWMKELRAEQLQKSTRPDSDSLYTQEAVISEYQLLEILCQETSGDCEIEMFLDSVISTISNDLSTVLRRARRSPDLGQDHLHTVLRHQRFTEWIENRHPDLILLDTDARSRDQSRRDVVSATSLLCASFLVGMKKTEANEVYVHFLCGLHRRSDDPWAGLSGLLRFVLIQLLLALRERELLNLDGIPDLSSHKIIKQLERADTAALCRLLHQFVRAFPPGTIVFCIIDGISLLQSSDSREDGCFQLVSCLQSIVQDDGLCPSFKVMLTEPSRPAPSTSWLTPFLEDNHIRLRSARLTYRHQGSRRGAQADFARLAAPARDRRSRSPWDRRQAQDVSGYAHSSGNWDEEESDEDRLDLDVSALLARG
ncbi:hypothetical protein BD289DRAFT_426517 [Coniella lustricola]|uniref:Uncharacterized protein n=1 Tax=Coniella lustricola TaxID=2025994 RepID=A0A2T3AG06_9PEZI|nr:hypothetical protein BD289DRAFT_426517 [Coniella lustricola]